MGCDIRFYNVVMLGVCFMLIFTAFQTSSNVQTDVLNSVVRDGKKIFKGAGYNSLAIIYSVFALANFLAPPVVSLIGPRPSMAVGGFCYCIFICSLIYPYLSTLYIASVIIGFGAAIIWTAQGNYLTINSNEETMGRNSGIFWALLQCSLLFGNMFVYFFFKGKVEIGNNDRMTLFGVLAICCGLGTMLIVSLRKPPDIVSSERGNESSEDDKELSVNIKKKEQYGTQKQTPLQAFKRSFELLRTKDMMLLSVTIAYTGLELTFFSGVYGTSVGNTQLLEDNKRMIGLAGMLIGAGEITGGLIFGILGKRTNKYGRDPIVLFGFLIHLVTFYLILINIPDNAPVNPTLDSSYLHQNIYVVGISAYMLGLGDSSFNTQLYSILGSLFSEDSAPAFALFKFVQSVAAAVAFSYSGHLILRWQLLILVILGFAGTMCFFKVERRSSSRTRDGYTPID